MQAGILALTPKETTMNISTDLAAPNQVVLKKEAIGLWIGSKLSDRTAFAQLQMDLVGLWRVRQNLLQTGAGVEDSSELANETFFTALYQLINETAAARLAADFTALDSGEQAAVKVFFAQLAKSRPTETFTKDIALFLESLGLTQVFRVEERGDDIAVFRQGEKGAAFVTISKKEGAAETIRERALPPEDTDLLTAQGFVSLIKLSVLQSASYAGADLSIQVPNAVSLPAAALAAVKDPIKFQQAFEITFLQALAFRNAVKGGKKPVILLSGAVDLAPEQTAMIDEMLRRHLGGRADAMILRAEPRDFQGLVLSLVDAETVAAGRARSENEITLSVAGLWDSEKPKNMAPHLVSGYGLLAGISAKAWDGANLAIRKTEVQAADLPRPMLAQYREALGREVEPRELLDLALYAVDAQVFRALAFPLPLIKKMDWSRISSAVWRAVASAA